MGMFDTVVVEGLKLPKLPTEVDSYLKKTNTTLLTNDFQTKDLNSSLSTYTINDKGQIYVTEYRPTGKKIPYRSPFEGWKDNRSFLERVYFKIKGYKYSTPKYTEERKPVKVKTNLTTTFEFYNYEEVAGRYVDVAYEAKAINGKVVKVTVKKAEIEPVGKAKARREQNAKFETAAALNIQKRKEFTSKWYYPILKETYNPFVFFTIKLVQAACNGILKLTYRWHGV